MSPRRISLYIIMGLVFSTTLIVYFIQAVSEPTQPESVPVPVPVEVTTIKPTPFTYNLEALGSLAPLREAEVSAQISGPIIRVPANVELGAAVKQGEVLAEIDPTPFRIEVTYREAQVARAKAGVHAREIEIARQRSLIPINLEMLRLAQAEQNRLKDLLKRELIAQQDLERTELAMHRIEEVLNRTESGLQEAKVQHTVAQAELASAEAQLARAKNSLKHTQVRAPFAGVISEKLLRLGEQVSPGKVLIRLADLSVVKLLIRVPPNDIDFLRNDMTAEVRVDGSSKPFNGKVAYIGPGADDKTRSFPVEILIENQGPVQLLPGMFGRASMPVHTYPEAILVPRASVLTPSGDPIVYVVDADRRIALHTPITIGRTFGSRHLVTDGLKTGDLLVVSGHPLLRNKAAIRIVGERELQQP
jgi:RND family efflux transporter MFP subunit